MTQYELIPVRCTKWNHFQTLYNEKFYYSKFIGELLTLKFPMIFFTFKCTQQIKFFTNCAKFEFVIEILNFAQFLEILNLKVIFFWYTKMWLIYDWTDCKKSLIDTRIELINFLRSSLWRYPLYPLHHYIINFYYQCQPHLRGMLGDRSYIQPSKSAYFTSYYWFKYDDNTEKVLRI